MGFITSLLGALGPILGLVLRSLGMSDEKVKALLAQVETWQKVGSKIPVQASDDEASADKALEERIKKEEQHETPPPNP